MKTVADYIVFDSNGISNKLVCKTIDFPAKGTFGAINKAMAYLSENGFSYGSMQCDSPIGFYHGNASISKWQNMNIKEKQMLDGIIVPIGDFRDGGARILFFSAKGELVGK